MSMTAMDEIILKVQDLRLSRDFYERTLGMDTRGDGDGYVRLDAGTATVTLQQDSWPSVDQWKGCRYDRSANLTFLVPDLPSRCAELESSDVSFTDRFNYEVGGIADFADPDGHWLSLYEPSELAMSWPGADKLCDASATSVTSPLVYVFLFVGDADIACDFYAGTLGLPVVDSRPCRRGSTMHDRGVVKYDAGAVLLTTHHQHDCPATAPRPTGTSGDLSRSVGASGVAPVLAVHGLDDLRTAIRDVKCIDWTLVSEPESVPTISISDPFGHRLFLRQTEVVPPLPADD